MTTFFGPSKSKKKTQRQRKVFWWWQTLLTSEKTKVSPNEVQKLLPHVFSNDFKFYDTPKIPESFPFFTLSWSTRIPPSTLWKKKTRSNRKIQGKNVPREFLETKSIACTTKERLTPSASPSYISIPKSQQKKTTTDLKWKKNLSSAVWKLPGNQMENKSRSQVKKNCFFVEYKVQRIIKIEKKTQNFFFGTKNGATLTHKKQLLHFIFVISIYLTKNECWPTEREL